MNTAVSRIKSAILRDETILRLGGDGCGYSMTWAADDRQLVTVLDGCGWPENPRSHHNSTRLFAMTGSPRNATFEDVPGYPDIPLTDLMSGAMPPYYGSTVLAVDESIYHFISTTPRQFKLTDRSTWADLRFTGAKLIYSPDNGRTWCNQDGSTPVVREGSAQDQTHRTMVFWDEPQHAFSLLSILQMGKGYRDNKDGYVYVYAPNGTTDGTMNELVMFRVPKGKILNRSSYEYFAGLPTNGDAKWAKDINARCVVLTFPRGWVHSTDLPPWAWQPSVVYNEPLGLYLMVNSGTGDKPCYLGIWSAPNPWGPWTQIYEDSAWMPAGDPAARAHGPGYPGPQISPKWIAEDGKSFWIVWADSQPSRGIRQTIEDGPLKLQSPDEFKRARVSWRQYYPYYGFNTQRVELDIA